MLHTLPKTRAPFLIIENLNLVVNRALSFSRCVRRRWELLDLDTLCMVHCTLCEL